MFRFGREGEGWVELANRMVVGWCMSGRTTADIVVCPGDSARSGYVAGSAILHSDRCSQYTSLLLASCTEANDVRLSAGRTSSYEDNGLADSFFGSLKTRCTS